MSSTNRKNASERHVSDYYVTPVASIREFLEAFNEDSVNLTMDFHDQNIPLEILDPCAGGDANHDMSYPVALTHYSGWNIGFIDTVDIREDSKAHRKCDYLKTDDHNIYDVIITNPPFNIAMDVIKKALNQVADGGVVIMLLRLNFFGSQERSAWFKENMPYSCYVHSKRMRFTNTGGTDSIEYMHAVWVKGVQNDFTRLKIL